MRWPGHREVDQELGLARMDDGAPPIAPPELDVVAGIEPEDLRVEPLRLVDVFHEHADDGDVGDHGGQATKTSRSPASPKLRSAAVGLWGGPTCRWSNLEWGGGRPGGCPG